MKSAKILFCLLLIWALVFYLLLIIGPVHISLSTIYRLFMNPETVDQNIYSIFWLIRFPKIITAMYAGSALAVGGLLMQTYFANPLAGPFVLGINSGASLGVALFVMSYGFISRIIPGIILDFGVSFFAICGSLLFLFLLLIVSKRVSGRLILLVMGLVFSYMIGGIINILLATSSSNEIKSFVLWNLGSFQRLSGLPLIAFVVIISICLIISLFFMRPLNLMLLGDNHSIASGMNVEKLKKYLIIITAILCGIVTANCGPIAFIGVIAPHLLRNIVKTNNHIILLPGVMIVGAICSMVAELLASMLSVPIPINGVLGLIGAPVLIFFIFRDGIKNEVGL